MKLLPILAATLMQEAHAVCDPNLPIFKVTCHEDLIVQLEGIVFFLTIFTQNSKIMTLFKLMRSVWGKDILT